MKRSPDVVIGLGLLLFSAFAAWRTLGVRVPPEDTIAGTTFVPWLMIGGIVLLSIGLIARAILCSAVAEAVEMPGRPILIRMGLFALLMVAYAFSFMTVGYLPSTLAVFVAGLLLLRESRLPVLVLFPLVMTGAIYLGFTQWLGVWLP